ncbi:shikimate dehydrogenase [Peteryoungia desertarenae]|uniref:Shikimate dehydrogenase (NADP(+)) n=1 Tax=Peteryoungia desertarenae TaxID=1813451 RepID=A0ABX6QJY3_9HYPH|nr:shikimate dehydrogenase [Peteryoungia desertarenae]QLF68861.1 shikimate dehydrogenase [Peteryoungia desertarenae]
MHDSRETIDRKAFVVGHPIKHSRSPLIHGYWLKQHGLDGQYEKVAVAPADFADFITDLKTGRSGYCGGNVTIPHKENAFSLADSPDDLASELGAANTLWREDGRLFATNTDGYGFVTNLDHEAPGWDAIDRAVVLGAGGACRSILQALRNRGIKEIHILNRTFERAQELAERFGMTIHAHPMEALGEVMSGAGLFVNTTSLGMDGQEVPALPFDRMRPDAIVTDIVYVPLITPILEQARKQGLRSVDGLGMLLHQAVPGFEKWFGVRPKVTAELRTLVIEDLQAHP